MTYIDGKDYFDQIDNVAGNYGAYEAFLLTSFIAKYRLDVDKKLDAKYKYGVFNKETKLWNGIIGNV